MKLLLLLSMLWFLLSEPQFPFVNGQLQNTTTTQHQMQHTHHNNHNHHSQHHRHHKIGQEQYSASLVAQEQATKHHTRHHHQQNNYHSNNGRKQHIYSIANHPTTTTTKPLTISHKIALTKTMQHAQQQQATTSSPTINSYSNNQQHKSLLNQHHDSQTEQQESPAYHHYQYQQQHQHHHHHQHQHQHQKNQHGFPLEHIDDGNRAAPKYIKTDEISRQNSKSMQHNHIDVKENEHTDYDDYYYQDESDGSSIDDTRDDNNNYDDTESYYQMQRDGAYNDHEYARVIRDHSHFIRKPPLYRQDDTDYTNDEPSHSNNGQDPALINNTKPGVLTEQKFRELGTPESVQKSRDKFLQDQMRARMEQSLARDHVRRMTIAARCSRPMPRVVYVSNETSKTYMPRGTILHRCGEDTGCCVSTGQVCTVKTYEDVELYFFVVNLANEFNTVNLVLRNHTECHCVERSNLKFDSARRGKRSGFNLDQTDDDDDDDDEDAICRCPKHYDALQENEHPGLETFGRTTEQRENSRVAYGAPPGVRSNNINCRCDCLSTNEPCQRLKNGEEGFSIEDRNCIAAQKCKAPKCRFGAYNLQTGRCPRLRNHKRAARHNDYGYG